MNKISLLFAILLILFLAQHAHAHCQIPCGIYDDNARFNNMVEHALTIEKSMIEINELNQAETVDYHAIVRWTYNKETHAEEIQQIVSDYFLTQRVKVPSSKTGNADYVKEISLLHQILVAAMKAKQTTALDHAKNILNLVEQYKKLYSEKHRLHNH